MSSRDVHQWMEWHGCITATNDLDLFTELQKLKTDLIILPAQPCQTVRFCQTRTFRTIVRCRISYASRTSIAEDNGWTTIIGKHPLLDLGALGGDPNTADPCMAFNKKGSSGARDDEREKGGDNAIQGGQDASQVDILLRCHGVVEVKWRMNSL